MSLEDLLSYFFKHSSCSNNEESLNKLVIRELTSAEKKKLQKLINNRQKLLDKALNIQIEFDKLNLQREKLYRELDLTIPRQYKKLTKEVDEELGLIYVYEPKNVT
jgi:hypothetical protein